MSYRDETDALRARVESLEEQLQEHDAGSLEEERRLRDRVAVLAAENERLRREKETGLPDPGLWAPDVPTPPRGYARPLISASGLFPEVVAPAPLPRRMPVAEVVLGIVFCGFFVVIQVIAVYLLLVYVVWRLVAN